MYVRVGFSEHPDTETAGTHAANQALANTKRRNPDVALLFCTTRHNPNFLRAAVTSVLGDIPIIGGAAVGVITNDSFGYAGAQVGVAAIWLDGVNLTMVGKGGLAGNENLIGVSLGNELKESGYEKGTPIMLLYDAINRNELGVNLNLATPLLAGMEEALGYLPPDMVGAGLQGDYDLSPSWLWTGNKAQSSYAMAISFPGAMKLESCILHGCRPYGKTYTVTKSDGQTILEIDNQPALSYMASQIQPSLPIEEFPFFIIFGVNRDPSGKEESSYANRLCLSIDESRQGITMFESDMVAGTEFRLMYRSLDLEYISPKVENLFTRAAGQNRRPVFAFYIDCAGRAAKFGGDLEDAVVVQESVANRVPLLGIYSGVEIAPIKRVPRTLDWTGVFCLFSIPAEA